MSVVKAPRPVVFCYSHPSWLHQSRRMNLSEKSLSPKTSYEKKKRMSTWHSHLLWLEIVTSDILHRAFNISSWRTNAKPLFLLLLILQLLDPELQTYPLSLPLWWENTSLTCCSCFYNCRRKPKGKKQKCSLPRVAACMTGINSTEVLSEMKRTHWGNSSDSFSLATFICLPKSKEDKELVLMEPYVTGTHSGQKKTNKHTGLQLRTNSIPGSYFLTGVLIPISHFPSPQDSLGNMVWKSVAKSVLQNI